MKPKIVLIDDKTTPYGVPCIKCGKIGRVGQFVFLYSIPDEMHVLMHRRCMIEILDCMPEDLDKSVEEEYNLLTKLLDDQKGEIQAWAT